MDLEAAVSDPVLTRQLVSSFEVVRSSPSSLVVHIAPTDLFLVRAFWFADGLWWFRPRGTEKTSEISSLMRSARYDAEALAIALCLGRRSFHRTVKDSLGLPPGIWLRQERAVVIRHQLRAGHLVKQLAADYGFKHPGDFSAEFKHWHGVNPSEFVAHHRSFQLSEH